MICEGFRKGQIKRFFREQFDVGARTVERYIRLARDQLVKETELDRRELVAQSYGFYMSVIRSSDASPKDKIAARKQADALLGLEAPRKIAPTSPDGETTYGAAAMAELMQLAEEGQRVEVIDTRFVENQLEQDLAEARKNGRQPPPADDEPTDGDGD